jgi:hypothetical protein
MSRYFDGLSTLTNGFSLGCHDHSAAAVHKTVPSAEDGVISKLSHESEDS